MFKKLFLFFFLFFPSLSMAASELPFTDVSIEDLYYTDLKYIYNAGIISDNSDHLFRPNGLLPRDEFAGTVVGVSCQKCITPSVEDIIHYNTNPFVDVLKKNQYFYCISYAKEKEIVRGYVLDATGKTQCQDDKTFSEVPFCPANNVTRIEAAAVLLRQSGLWDETQNNSSYMKKVIMQDVDAYWYGYAQKAVQTGLIFIDKDGKIFPDEYITRKEFVVMASKIYAINMCSVKESHEPADFGSIIKIFDKNKKNCSESQAVTTFQDSTATTYDFGGYVAGNVTLPATYNWTFTNVNTNEQITATGSCLDDFNLKTTGSWIAKLTISDANGKSSTSYQHIFVDDTNTIDDTNTNNDTTNSNNNGLSVQISNSKDLLKTASMTLYGTVGTPMPFFSTTTGGDGNYSYSWDFSDGGTATDKDPTHTFMMEGAYVVPLIVYDTSGNVAHAQLTVVITPDPDKDKDGVLNIQDSCPSVFGPASNKGCPVVNEYSSNETINNLCLTNKIKTSGMIEGSVQCVSCPCAYSSDFVAQIRSCDIIFPSITSPDKKTLYSRGGIYSVP